MFELVSPDDSADDFVELRFVATFCGARLVALELHERAHALAARLLGFTAATRPLFKPVTAVPGVSKHHTAQAAIRHSGWLASVALALALEVCPLLGTAVRQAFWLVALEAVAADLLGLGSRVSTGDQFFCEAPQGPNP